jgi:hypothetical protein
VSVPDDVLAAVRRAAASRPEIARVVLVERHVEPRSDEPFDEHSFVLVLDELPSEPAGFERTRELTAPLLRAVAGAVENVGVTLPSPAGLRAATSGGVGVYERDAS